MRIDVNVTVDDAALNAIINNMPLVDNMVVTEGAIRTRRNARAHVPVRTGFLRSTINFIVQGATAMVEALAGYALFVELGTRKMAAQPYMIPGLEGVRWDDLVRKVLKAIGL